MNKNISDKILGSFLGYAVGDALGKGTEFMSESEIRIRYPGGLRNYDQIIRDAHRSQWDRTDFTFDTEIVLALAETIIRSGRVDIRDFAKTISDLEKQHPYELDSRMRLIIRDPQFLADPIETARQQTEAMEVYEARNEALGRALLIGTTRGDYPLDITLNCRATHFDTRCVSSALVIGKMAHTLLWEQREATLDELVEIARNVDERTVSYIETAYNGSLADFHLDDPDSYWYTRKSMGAALWAVRHATAPEEALFRIVGCGGDADTNAALAMGLLGLKYGSSAVPEELSEKLLQYDRVADCAVRWSEFLEKQA